MKKIACIFCSLLLFMTGCDYDTNKIALFSREEGSGTREMFVKGLGVMSDGKDDIFDMANITNSGAVMLSAVAQNKNAIGFISAATVNDKVRSVTIDSFGVDDGENYPLFRDFIVAFDPSEINEATADFLSFLGSERAGSVVNEMGYYVIKNQTKYEGLSVEGKIVIAGSASVFPLMDRLREEYCEFQKNVEIEIQQNDSSTGISLLKQGMCDIAMSSRNIKSGELGTEFENMSIAGDAIAVIVHPENKKYNFTSTQLRDIFNGKILEWDKVNE